MNFSGVSQETLNQSMGGGSSRANSLPRPISPTPSVASEKYEGDLQVKVVINEMEIKQCKQRYYNITLCVYCNSIGTART